MMPYNNVTQISSHTAGSQATQPVTLENLAQSMQEWRLKKTQRNEKIPVTIWDTIFLLIEKIPQAKVLRAAKITHQQFHLEKDERNRLSAQTTTEEHKQTTVDFCEAQPLPPVAYKPAKAFDTSTSVVEFFRADGALMKIHLCTDRFHELLSAFFGGK